MKLLSKLIPLFIIIPLIELALLIQIGKLIGAWQTIGLVIITGILGAVLAQMEGLRTWTNLQSDLVQAKMPTDRIIDGVMILVGGILLLTPGVLTDIFGFSLILPFTRPAYRHFLKKKFKGRFNQPYQRDNVKVVEILENKK